MKRFDEAISGDGWAADEHGAALRLPPIDHKGKPFDRPWHEVRIEPLLFGQFYLAVYECKDDGFGHPLCTLIGEKVPVRPGGGGQGT